MLQLDQNTQDDEKDLAKNRYLVFSMGSELYGVPLLQVREVIKAPRPSPVPHTVAWFKGITNLRGQIVSVIDLRQKFSLNPGQDRGGYALIVQCGTGTNSGIIGAIIDELKRVQEFPENIIARDPEFQTQIPTAHILGVARSGDELVQLIDLNAILSEQEYKSLTHNRKAA